MDPDDAVRPAGTGSIGGDGRGHRNRRSRHNPGQLNVASAQAPFAGWRVLEFSNGIAAAYGAKMFADAGAEVVKIESPQGDLLRSWSAGSQPGALFGYLAAGKKSVVCHDRAEITALLAGADVVFTDLTDGWVLDDITAHTSPSAVVVSVTPFGTTGPYVEDNVVANEFILQALCGSIAGRGWPGDEPVQAGGRLGDWLAGTFAAAVAAAAARHAARGGRGRSRRRLDIRGDGDRNGRIIHHVGQRSGRGFPD